MNDPVLRVLIARRSMAEEGYSRSLLVSSAVHASLFFGLLIVTLLTPREKIIHVIDGFAVPLPRGGGMPRPAQPEAAPAPEVKAPPKPAAPAPEKLIKPESATIKKGLAPVDLKRSVREPKEKTSREVATERIEKPARTETPPAPANAATGLDFTAQTPGVINGTTGPVGPLGFYLAAAQNRIWATWARQIRPDLAGNVKVAFTIHRDGTIDQVEVLQSSGSPTVDRLAERAIISTQLSPLPNAYEKETLVVHANFKPVS